MEAERARTEPEVNGQVRPPDDVRTVVWVTAPEPGLRLIDQTRLPHDEVYVDCTTVDAVVDAIRRLVVRGAPAIGAAGAYGIVVAMLQGQSEGWTSDELQRQIDRVRHARPTAVNLAWAVDRVRPLVEQGPDRVLAEATSIAGEDLAANRELGRRGADWILGAVASRPVRALTHCNAGALATTGWGTALGVIRELHTRGELGVVRVDETRPLLQGARLTAWELGRARIDYVVQADGAAASAILRGLVDVAVIGADRVARNGDVANKIGSLAVALACADAGVPLVVAAPTSTIDLGTDTGSSIEIEMRDGDEVLTAGGRRMAPVDAIGENPAFDVTPARLVSAVVTERGVVEPDGQRSLDHLVP